MHAGRVTSKGAFILFILLPTAIHLLAYPALVWIISKLFFDHTFTYWQNFQYGLTEYALTILAIYSIALLLFRSSVKTNTLRTVNSASLPLTPLRSTITQIVVAEGHQRLSISTSEVSYIIANSPYVTIHHHAKSYLHSDTLKSMLPKLDQQRFIRIHKSVIVNISMVQSYRSRLNGDYDVTMLGGTVLRLSRIYASQFKEKFKLIGLQ
jgi:DNA-binding LytR/AlgR family response regulator